MSTDGSKSGSAGGNAASDDATSNRDAELTENERERERRAGQSGALYALVFWVIAGTVVISASQDARDFLTDWPKALIVELPIGLLVIGLLVRAVGIKLAGWAPSRRVALLVVIIIPAVLLVVVGPVFLLGASRAFALAMVFWLVASLLPASMYYLFLATRKRSLLHEYVANLRRLRLIDGDGAPSQERAPGDAHPTAKIDRELKNLLRYYLNKFEAAYAPLANKERLVQQLAALSGPKPSVEPTTATDEPDSWDITSLLSPAVGIPLALATALVALGWLLVLALHETVAMESFGLREVLRSPQSSPAHYAFLGAYFFAVQALFRRYVRRDLGPSAYLGVALRIVLAVIGAWVVTLVIPFVWSRSASEEELIVPISIAAFVVGVFPRVAWQFVVGALRKFPGGLVLPSLKSGLPLNRLDGLTVWHETRLEEEDVENVPNLATADLVDLMLHTRFPPGRVIDWVDQALLYTCIGSKTQGGGGLDQALRAHGIRTATGLLEVRRGDPQFDQRFDESDRERVRSLLNALLIYPNLRLVCAWRGLPAPAVKPAP